MNLPDQTIWTEINKLHGEIFRLKQNVFWLKLSLTLSLLGWIVFVVLAGLALAGETNKPDSQQAPRPLSTFPTKIYGPKMPVAPRALPRLPNHPKASRAARQRPVQPADSGSIIGLITAAARHHGVSPAMMIELARCESSLNPNAVNRRSGAAGLFQHMPRYWKERSARYGFAGWSVFNPRANAFVAAGMLADGMRKHWSC